MAETSRFQIPYPAPADAPDGPGAYYALAQWLDNHVAPTDAVCHAVWNSTTNDQTIVANGWTDIANDTVIYDGRGMRLSDNLNFQVPWAGRYSLYTRIALVQPEPTAALLSWLRSDGTPAELAWKSIPLSYTDSPFDIYTEQILPAGASVRSRYFRSSTTAQAIRRNVGNQNRAEQIIRYLGPA